MRFDPKLMPADSLPADGADDLPEDLGLLGRALSDDAARLAERYPADHSSSTPIATSAARSWHATATAAAAVALVAASVALAVFLGGWPRQPGQPRLAGHAFVDQGLAGQELARQGRASGLLADSERLPGDVQIVPAANVENHWLPQGDYFRELSSSEQEAVLDLLEENALAQSSVSI